MTLQRSLLGALVALLVAVPRPATAQFVSPDSLTLVDRVVAVVGDSIVLLSQIQQEVLTMEMAGMQIPQDPTGRRRLFEETLDQAVNRLLILQAAARDSLIQVDEEAVTAAVQEEIDRRTQAFGGPAQMQQALQTEGLTMGAYRELLATQVRQEQIQQLFMQRQLQGARPVVLEEAELLQAFQEARSQLQQRPRTVTLEQVVVTPAPSAEADTVARVKAQAILDSIQAGADFSEMAQRHSQDPGTAAQGGDLDWFRRGQMVREFEDAAFGLRDGQTSGLVKTEFGYHIIRVERSRPGERRGRHILIIPEGTAEDVEEARSVAESVATQARAGVSMLRLADQYSDPAAPDTLTITYDQIQQLPPGYGAVRTAAQGDVIGPVEYQTARGETRLAVIRVRSIREAGAWTFEEVRNQLEQRLVRQKQIEQIVERLKARTHIEIRM